MADHEHSGDGISSIVTTTVGSISSVLFSISANKSEEQNATTPTETEVTTPEMNGNDSILYTALIIGIPIVVLLVLLIILVIFIVRRHKQKQSQEGKYFISLG